jgi:hypothetical protein
MKAEASDKLNRILGKILGAGLDRRERDTWRCCTDSVEVGIHDGRF